MSTHAETARIEAAAETLAEYIGYLSGEVDAEQEKATPNAGRIAALEHELADVLSERRALTTSVIDRALYVYAPMLKGMRCLPHEIP